MSPELLKQIEARDKEYVATPGQADVSFSVWKDRRALLDYCRELEAERDEARKHLIEGVANEIDLLGMVRLLEATLDWVNDWHHGDLGSLHAPPHLAPILEASRQRIKGSGKT